MTAPSLAEHEITLVRAMRSAGVTLHSIAEQTGFHYASIQRCCRGVIEKQDPTRPTGGSHALGRTRVEYPIRMAEFLALRPGDTLAYHVILPNKINPRDDAAFAAAHDLMKQGVLRLHVLRLSREDGVAHIAVRLAYQEAAYARAA